eukprot:97565_1
MADLIKTDVQGCTWILKKAVLADVTQLSDKQYTFLCSLKISFQQYNESFNGLIDWNIRADKKKHHEDKETDYRALALEAIESQEHWKGQVVVPKLESLKLRAHDLKYSKKWVKCFDQLQRNAMSDDSISFEMKSLKQHYCHFIEKGDYFNAMAVRIEKLLKIPKVNLKLRTRIPAGAWSRFVLMDSDDNIQQRYDQTSNKRMKLKPNGEVPSQIKEYLDVLNEKRAKSSKNK